MYIMRGPESETVKRMISILLGRQGFDWIGKRELIKKISEERQISKVSAYKAYNILKASGIIREENVVFYEFPIIKKGYEVPEGANDPEVSKDEDDQGGEALIIRGPNDPEVSEDKIFEFLKTHEKIITAVKIDYEKIFQNHMQIKLRKYEDELNSLGFSKDKIDVFLNLEELRLFSEIVVERIKTQERFMRIAFETDKKNKEEGELVWEYLRSLEFKYLSSYIDDWKAL